MGYQSSINDPFLLESHYNIYIIMNEQQLQEYKNLQHKLLQERLIIETKNVQIEKQMLESDLNEFQKQDLADRQELEEMKKIYREMKELEIAKKKQMIINSHK